MNIKATDYDLISSLMDNFLFKISDDYMLRYQTATLDIVSEKYQKVSDQFIYEISSKKYSPNVFFDTKLYESNVAKYQNRNVDHAVTDYVYSAGKGKISAHWLFDEEYVQNQCVDLADAVQKGNIISAYYAYLTMNHSCLDDIDPHWLFSHKYFCYKYGQSKRSWIKFIKMLQNEDVECSVFFNEDYYKNIAPNISGYRNADGYRSNLLEHFIKFGHPAGIIPLPDFDPDFYLREYPDIAASVNNGLLSSAFEHFVKYGHKEFRNPNKYFSSEEYFNLNSTVRTSLKDKEFSSPFEHFLAVGYKNRLPARQPLANITVSEFSGKSLFEKKAKIRAQSYQRNKISWRSSAKIKTSFIVPAHNNFIFTASLINQLHSVFASNNGEFELILVDNGSTDETRNIITSDNLVVLRINKQLGYTKACNEGARIARGDTLVFLNNDIEIEPDTINSLLKNPIQKKSIVGPKIIATTGVLQEAGTYVFPDGSCIGYGRGEDPNDFAFSYERDVDSVSGCFLIIERDFFFELGEFDEVFSPGYYEDTDLCLRAIQAGGTVIYNPNWIIYHYEYASYSKGRPPAISMSLMEKNKNKFLQKHSHFLSSRDIKDVFPRVIKKYKKSDNTVLLIEDDVPEYSHGSGFSRTSDIIEAFLKNGISVFVWPIHNNGIIPPIQWHNENTLNYINPRNWSGSFTKYLAEEGWRFSMIWICRTHNIRSLGPLTEQWRRDNPTRRIVFDTEAIDAIRQISLMKLVDKDISQAETEKSIKEELGDVSFVDNIVVVNNIDADAVSNAVHINPKIIGHKFKLHKPNLSWEERDGVGFLGALYSRATPNFDSLVWYHSSVLPRLKELGVSIETLVAGHSRFNPSEDPLFCDDDLKYIGEVEDVKTYFDRLRALIAPTRYAGGIPHKVQNAMAHGLPVVMTDLLAKQLGLSGANYPEVLISPISKPEMFAQGIKEINSNAQLWSEASEAGLNYIQNICDEGDFDASVLLAVNRKV